MIVPTYPPIRLVQWQILLRGCLTRVFVDWKRCLGTNIPSGIGIPTSLEAAAGGLEILRG